MGRTSPLTTFPTCWITHILPILLFLFFASASFSFDVSIQPLVDYHWKLTKTDVVPQYNIALTSVGLKQYKLDIEAIDKTDKKMENVIVKLGKKGSETSYIKNLKTKQSEIISTDSVDYIHVGNESTIYQWQQDNEIIVDLEWDYLCKETQPCASISNASIRLQKWTNHEWVTSPDTIYSSNSKFGALDYPLENRLYRYVLDFGIYMPSISGYGFQIIKFNGIKADGNPYVNNMQFNFDDICSKTSCNFSIDGNIGIVSFESDGNIDPTIVETYSSTTPGIYNNTNSNLNYISLNSTSANGTFINLVKNLSANHSSLNLISNLTWYFEDGPRFEEINDTIYNDNFTNLIGLWHMNENTGTLALDSSGNSNTCTLTAANWQSGKFNSATGYNSAAANYATCGAFPTWNMNGDWTITFWMYRNSSHGSQTTLSKGNATNGIQFFGGYGAAAQSLLEVDNGTAQSSGAISNANGIWHFFSIRKEGTNITFTRNVNFSVAADSKTIIVASGNLNNTRNLAFGTLAYALGAAPFNGSIDDVAIWTRALPLNEIYKIYYSTAHRYTNVTLETRTANLSFTNSSDTGTYFNMDKLLGYYEMDYRNSSVIYDNSSYLRNGSFTDISFVENNIFGTSATFSTVNSSIQISNPISTNDGISISAWIKQTNSTSGTGSVQTIYSLGTNSAGYHWLYYQSSVPALFWQHRNASGNVALFFTYTLPLNKQTHVTVVHNYTTQNISMYVNGILLSTQSSSIVIPVTAKTSTIGQYNGGGTYNWNGSIDELLVFNRTLTAAEVNQLYVSGLLKYGPWQPNTTEQIGQFYQIKSIQSINNSQADAWLFNHTLGYDQITLPTITFVNQIPTDISTSSLANSSINVTYNISNGSFPITSVNLYYKTNSTLRTYLIHFNGTSFPPNYTLKTYNTTNGINYTWIFDDNEVFPVTGNLNDTYFDNNIPSPYVLYGNNVYYGISLFNITNKTEFNIIEIMANTSGMLPLEMFVCNSSYDFASNLLTSSNCAAVTSLASTPSFNHTEAQNNKHNLIPFIIINNSINGVNISSYMTFVFHVASGNPASAWNIYHISNLTRPDVVKETSDKGVTWLQTGTTKTPNMHLHQFNGTAIFFYYACINNTYGLSTCSNIQNDTLQLGGNIPTAPFIYSPNGTLNYTANSTIIINYTQALSSGTTINYYNISLYYANLTFITTIQANNSLNLSFAWNSTGYDGTFRIGVRVYDISNLTNEGFSDEFTIYNPTNYTVENMTHSTPYFGTLVNFSADVFCANGILNYTVNIDNGTGFFTFNDTHAVAGMPNSYQLNHSYWIINFWPAVVQWRVFVNCMDTSGYGPIQVVNTVISLDQLQGDTMSFIIGLLFVMIGALLAFLFTQIKGWPKLILFYGLLYYISFLVPILSQYLIDSGYTTIAESLNSINGIYILLIGVMLGVTAIWLLLKTLSILFPTMRNSVSEFETLVPFIPFKREMESQPK